MTGYIDAEKMQSHLEEEIEGCGNPTADNNPIAYGTTLGLKMALSYAKTLPTADVAPVVHAHWKQVSEKYPRYVCTACNHLFNNKGFKYCPFCGANMDERVKSQ